jgi:hypothetical protein
MVNLKNLKNLVESNPSNITTTDFVNLHVGIESYLKRLLFIGLRLNGVQYKTATEVVSMTNLQNRQLIKKTIKLISQNKKTLTDFENHNTDFKVILDLFFEFTSVYRNRVVHGVDEIIYDNTILRYCYFIDKCLIREFEMTLISHGFNSAFDTPKTWGASRSKNTENFDEIIKRLDLGKIAKTPRGIISVQNTLSRTKYRGKI